MKFYAGLDVGGTSGRVKFSAEDKDSDWGIFR